MVVDDAAGNLDLRVAVDATGRGAVAYLGALGVGVVHTAAATVDVAAVDRRAVAGVVLVVLVLEAQHQRCVVGEFIGAVAVDAVVGSTAGIEGRVVQRDAADDAAVDVDVGVDLHVAVLAAAEDRTADDGYLVAVVVDHHDGVAREGRVGVVLVDGVVVQCTHTAARAEDHARVGTEVVVVELGEHLLLLGIGESIIPLFCCFR